MSERFARPPRALRQRGVRLDNLTLAPASMLPYQNLWQQLANRLPRGSVLILLPTTRRAPRRTLEKVAVLLSGKGQLVATLEAARLA